MTNIVSKDFHRQVREGYGLTTAQIFYRFPDNPRFINPNFLVWQEYDLAPKFPELMEYLRKWDINCEGKVAHVKVAHSRLIRPTEIAAIDGEFRLH